MSRCGTLFSVLSYGTIPPVSHPSFFLLRLVVTKTFVFGTVIQEAFSLNERSLLKKSPMDKRILRSRYHFARILRSKGKVMRLPGLFPAVRRMLLPLLPEICDSTILLSDALCHGASTGWSVL